MKKPDASVREYLRRLPDDEVQFLSGRIGQKLGGDLGLVAELLQRDSSIDKVLQSLDNAEEWFDVVDRIGELAQYEISNRNKK